MAVVDKILDDLFCVDCGRRITDEQYWITPDKFEALCHPCHVKREEKSIKGLK